MESNEYPIEASTHSSCPACDSQRVTEEFTSETFQYGSGNDAIALSVRVPLCRCTECGLNYTDERAEKIKHSAVCRHLRILEPEQIVAIRERYRMSQQAFAALSRIGRASLARWESGAVFQNASIDSLLYLLGFPENLSRLSDRFMQSEAQVVVSEMPRTRRFRSVTDEQAVFIRQAMTFELHPGH